MTYCCLVSMTNKWQNTDLANTTQYICICEGICQSRLHIAGIGSRTKAGSGAGDARKVLVHADLRGREVPCARLQRLGQRTREARAAAEHRRVEERLPGRLGLGARLRTPTNIWLPQTASRCLGVYSMCCSTLHAASTLLGCFAHML